MSELGRDKFFNISVCVNSKEINMDVVYSNEKKLRNYLGKAGIEILKIKDLNMETFVEGKEYRCIKCGKKYGKAAYNREKDCLEFLCECGYMYSLKPLQETAITEVIESDKPILLG